MVAISRVWKSMSIVAAAAIALAGAPQASDAHTIGMRAGKPNGPTTCWQAFGPSVKNVCDNAQDWNIQLLDGSCYSWGCGSLVVTVQASQFSSDVQCRAMSWHRWALLVFNTGYFSPTQYGVPQDIFLPSYVPAGGTQDIDCTATKNGQLFSVTY